jgi:hypothetical protein
LAEPLVSLPKKSLIAHAIPRRRAAAAWILVVLAAGCGDDSQTRLGNASPPTSAQTVTTEERVDENLTALIGLNRAEAEARVKEMGLLVKIVQPGEATSMERRHNRVILKVRDGKVIEAWRA